MNATTESMAGVRASTAHEHLMEDLLRQDVGHNLSIVSSICGSTPLDTILVDATPITPSGEAARTRLQQVSGLLRAAYGYRLCDARVSRYAPSAGARYPTEVIVILNLDGAWRSAIFDFRTRIFHEGRHSKTTGATVAQRLCLSDDCVFVGALSVLWRTIQRYGLRGHRYCIVDAVCVISNVMDLGHQGRARGYVGPDECAVITSLLGLPASTPLVAGTKVDLRDLIVQGERAEGLPDAAARHVFVEETPAMSPKLRRAEMFHLRAAAEAMRSTVLHRKSSVLGTEGAAGDWIASRRSMRDGCAAPIPDEIESELRRDIHGVLNDPRASLGVELAIVWMSFDRHKRITQVVACEAAGEARCLKETTLKTAGELASRCFEGQTVVGAASVVALVGPRRLADLADHGAYLLACHQVGHVIAASYRTAVKLGVASTAIGGFSWEELKKQVDMPGFYPLMAHAFGYGVQVGGKEDVESWQSNRRDTAR